MNNINTNGLSNRAKQVLGEENTKKLESISHIGLGQNLIQKMNTVYQDTEPLEPFKRVPIDEITSTLQNNNVLEDNQTRKENIEESKTINQEKANETINKIKNDDNELYNTIAEIIKNDRTETWARDDKIRKETQQREDTAYQRAVADLRRAGINPNLINLQPASSGGGIIQTNSGYETLANNITSFKNASNEQILNHIDKALSNLTSEQTTLDNVIANINNAELQAIVSKWGTEFNGAITSILGQMQEETKRWVASTGQENAYNIAELNTISDIISRIFGATIFKAFGGK